VFVCVCVHAAAQELDKRFATTFDTLGRTQTGVMELWNHGIMECRYPVTMQVKLAVELRKPLFMHCRDAGDSFAEILRCVLVCV
jgi:hypothetical protein